VTTVGVLVLGGHPGSDKLDSRFRIFRSGHRRRHNRGAPLQPEAQPYRCRVRGKGGIAEPHERGFRAASGL
jgi:hypothetical protein